MEVFGGFIVLWLKKRRCIKVKEENKMTVGKLKELLSKYNDNDQVILCTGFYTERGGVDWVETEKFTLTHDGRDILYIEGDEAQ